MKKYIIFLFSLFSTMTLYFIIYNSTVASENYSGNEPIILERIDIESVPLTRQDGTTWDDDASGPDVFLALVDLKNNEQVYSTGNFNNIRNDGLPKYSHLEQRISMSNREWLLVMYEQDDLKREEMASWTFSPGIDEDETELEREIGDGKAKVELKYQEVER